MSLIGVKDYTILPIAGDCEKLILPLYQDSKKMLVYDIQFQLLKQVLAEIGGFFTVLKQLMLILLGPWISMLFIKNLSKKLESDAETIKERISYEGVF